MVRVLLLLLFLIAGCSRSGSVALSTSRDSEPRSPSRFLVVHGGFNSCGRLHNTDQTETAASEKSIFDSFHYLLVAGDCGSKRRLGQPCYKSVAWLEESLIEQLPKTLSVDWFVSCQDFSVKHLRWVDSSQPTTERSGSREEMWADLVQFAAGKAPADIAGHSYGGWTAMQSVLKIETQTHSLTTIDPISPVKCPLAAVRAGREGCKQFPSDIDASMQQRILDRTGSWFHYWQTEDDGNSLLNKGLHSGPVAIRGVDQSKLAVNHLQLNRQAAIWGKFKSIILGEERF